MDTYRGGRQHGFWAVRRVLARSPGLIRPGLILQVPTYAEPRRELGLVLSVHPPVRVLVKPCPGVVVHTMPTPTRDEYVTLLALGIQLSAIPTGRIEVTTTDVRAVRTRVCDVHVFSGHAQAGTTTNRPVLRVCFLTQRKGAQTDLCCICTIIELVFSDPDHAIVLQEGLHAVDRALQRRTFLLQICDDALLVGLMVTRMHIHTCTRAHVCIRNTARAVVSANSSGKRAVVSANSSGERVA